MDAETLVHLDHIKELEELQDLIGKLNLDNPFTAENFVQYDNSELTTEMISDEEILKVVLPNSQEKEVDELVSDPLPPIHHGEAIEFYDKIILYLEQQEINFNMKKEEVKFIKKLKKDALKQQFISAKQTILDNFINIA
ncbi:hypothetical protein C1645_740034 [Glomus cerebriforme]|uniref:Uncharacterized protein n=1 Tax=Glomus cerebriforme TaxID=658196 RepID=A0A397SFR0_9GLOM|nr:hypothetical protein C1645_742148 [Glomus cerebriforme]RIA84848.1 hypothetical protein C1645_742038 [Glomus cerebriforme]RIA87523.1 hypothetical protein C1645_740034 [Glomus cerebriforme]